MNSEAIGGFLPLELPHGEHYHVGPHCESLNTARNCLEHLLNSRGYERIFLPYFLCEVLTQSVQKAKVRMEFYCIDEFLEPIFDFNWLNETDAFLYINYFGIKDDYARSLAKRVANLIIDNAQAFFAIPYSQVSSFYSARKFFGVPDGAYLYTKDKLNEVVELDLSYNRMEHLMQRIDEDAESAYGKFVLNEKELDNQPIRRMSKLTTAILSSICYKDYKNKRMENFAYYHNNLRHRNLLKIDNWNFEGPLSYPFWTKNTSIKQTLLANRVFTPTYWPNVLRDLDSSMLEFELASEIVHLPVDQRYSSRELDYVLNLLE